jgi:hypothetical protein
MREEKATEEVYPQITQIPQLKKNLELCTLSVVRGPLRPFLLDLAGAVLRDFLGVSN